MAIHRLTATKIAALVRAGRQGRFADGGGLYLQLDGKSASWIFRYRRAGRERAMGVGPTHTVSLENARAAALVARRGLLDGVDPLAERSRARGASKTFKECVALYLADKAGTFSVKHKKDWQSTLARYAGPIIGALPVDAVDRAQMIAVLKPIWTEKPKTAGQVRGRIEDVLDWAAFHGLRSGENPARWSGNLEHALPPLSKVHRVEHFAALPHADLPGFMRELRAQTALPARALEFLILTGCRTGDLIGQIGADDKPPMRWTDIDLAERLWTIPSPKGVGDLPHIVPLAKPAIALLAELKALKLSELVFPSLHRPRFPLDKTAMLYLLKTMGREGLTVHGFRATFKTWAEEESTFDSKVIEAALSHGTVEDKLGYHRGDFFRKRVKLMDAWAQYITHGDRGAKVVALR